MQECAALAMQCFSKLFCYEGYVGLLECVFKWQWFCFSYVSFAIGGIKEAERLHVQSCSAGTFNVSCYAGAIAYCMSYSFRSFNFPHPEGITLNSNLSYLTCQDWETRCISQLQFRHGIELLSLEAAGILLPLKQQILAWPLNWEKCNHSWLTQ